MTFYRVNLCSSGTALFFSDKSKSISAIFNIKAAIPNQQYLMV